MSAEPAKISEVVLAEMPRWSAHSGSSPARTEREALITTTATPSVSRVCRCAQSTERTEAKPSSRCCSRPSRPRSGISWASRPAATERAPESRKTEPMP